MIEQSHSHKTLLWVSVSITCPAASIAAKWTLMTLQTTTAVSLKKKHLIQYYLRSPTNNILTSLRILSGVDRLGGRVFVKHLYSCLDEG